MHACMQQTSINISMQNCTMSCRHIIDGGVLLLLVAVVDFWSISGNIHTHTRARTSQMYGMDLISLCAC